MFKTIGLARRFAPIIRAGPWRFMSMQTIKVPTMGESISQGAVQSWVKKAGEYVEMDQVVVVIESDKLSQQVRTPVAGQLKQLLASQGDQIPVGADLFIVDTSVQQSSISKQSEPKSTPEPVKQETKQPPKPVQSEPQKPKQSPPKSQLAPKPVLSNPTPLVQGNRSETRQKISRMRKRIAERLKGSQNTYAMLTTFQECDMSRAMELRNAYKQEFEKSHGIKIGFMSFFVKAATHALLKNPIANAVIDDDEIVYRNYVDISVAVATPSGLVVPVLRDCQTKSFADIQKDIANYAGLAKKNQLALEDMQGGNFTISNGGVYGSMMGMPIINPPQSAILGMHNIENRPVVRGDQIVARPMMYLALTYDHRLLDGKDAVSFLRTIKLSVEEPTRILLEL